MEEMAISKFKATCLAVLDRVRRTRTPVLITRFGEAVAEVVPPSTGRRPERWLGALKASGQIRGDVVSPVLDAKEWDALRS